MQQEVLMWVISGVSAANFGLLTVIWSELKAIREKADENAVAIAHNDAKLDAIDARVERLPCHACK